MSPSSSFSPSPPSHSTNVDLLRDRDIVGYSLPGYTHRQVYPDQVSPVGLTSTATTGAGALVKLMLESDQISANSLPVYTEGEPIRGRVALNLPNPQTIREVIVEIRGSLSLDSSSTSEAFFSLPLSLWKVCSASQRRSSSPDSDSSSDTTQTYNRKLFGEPSWFFRVGLPKEVLVPFGPEKELGIFKLPHSFTERHSRLSIAYEVRVRVRRSRFTSDCRASLAFVYIPATRPGPPSLLRQLAYRQNRPIPSPGLDPEGWYTANPLQVKGNIFGRAASITCRLSVPKPLVYARETPIPISLLLESENSEALDILSSPQSITVRLRRTIKYRAKRNKKFDGWNDATEYSQLASWWDCPETDPSVRHRRRICGELHVHKDTQPTTAIADFRIEYALVLLPFDDTTFRGTFHKSEPLMTIPVEITTMQAYGPQPCMYAPPSYDSTDTRHIGSCVPDIIDDN